MSGTMANPAPTWGDPTLPDAEKAALAALCARMIPASAEFNVPGADDPLIQADIASSISRDATSVHNSLALLDRLAGGDFAALPEAHSHPSWRRVFLTVAGFVAIWVIATVAAH